MNIIFWQLVVPRLVELRHRAGQAGVVEDKRIVVAGSNNLEGADRAARHPVDQVEVVLLYQVEVVLLYQAVAALRCPIDQVAVELRHLVEVALQRRVEPQRPAEAARQHLAVQLLQVGQVEVAAQHRVVQVVVGSNSLEEDKRIAEAVRAALRHPVGRAVAEQQFQVVVVLRHLVEAVRRLRVEVALQRRVEPQHPVVQVAVVEDNKPVVDRRTVVAAGSQVEERIVVVEPCPRTA
jgi:hypothetical protein